MTSLRGSLDEPADSALSRIPQRFWGWCLEGSAAAQRVEVIFNQSTRLDAELGLPRLDVPINLGEPAVTPSSGWEAWMDFSEWPPGSLDVVVRAFGRSGAATTLASRGFSLTGTRVAGSLEAPREGDRLNDGLLVVRGWAVIEGELATRVEVSIDGRLLGLARLCLAPPGMAPRLAKRFGGLTGFEFRGVLPPADHDTAEVTVEVIGRRGAREILASRTVSRESRSSSTADRKRTAQLRERTERLVRASGGLHGRVGAERDGRPSLLVFTHSLTIGGGQLYLRDLLPSLVPHLARCTLLSPIDEVLRKDAEALGVDVVITGSQLSPDLDRYEGDIRDLCFFIQGTGADVVLVNTLGGYRSVDAAVRTHVPVIWSIHESFALSDWLGLNLGDGRWHPYLKERLMAALGSADRLVFEADATRELVASEVDRSRSVVVAYGVDISGIDRYASGFDRAAGRAKHDLPPGTTVLLAIGVVEERKGHGSLIDAFMDVASAHPEAVLVVVGDHPSPYSAALHDLIDSRGMHDRVRLLPIKPDIWEWYALSDVLVSASDVEFAASDHARGDGLRSPDAVDRGIRRRRGDRRRAQWMALCAARPGESPGGIAPRSAHGAGRPAGGRRSGPGDGAQGSPQRRIR